MKYEETRSPSQTAAANIAATSTTVETADEPSHDAATYRVIKIVDGDTLTLDIDGKSTTLRLIGLDTPETSDPRKPVQCFGVEASNKAKEILTGKNVSIEKDPSQGELDKYGRLLAYVYLPDGTLFNKLMIEDGYGHEYTYNLPYKYQTQFKAAERKAREDKKGLWADEACTASLKLRSTSASPEISVTPIHGSYECSRNAYNCSSFKTQAEAQAAFEACGGASNDVHKLDSDKDGVVCETLQ